MRNTILLSLLLYSIPAGAQLSDPEIRAYKQGRVIRDTSPVYELPFPMGHKAFLIQAANSKMSHSNELSLDFKMKTGSMVCAARSGIVITVKSDSDEGGLKDEYMNKGNHVIIRHADQSIAKYWHLKANTVLVKQGDSVVTGQPIARSGNTGYSAFPHLHFQVQDSHGRQLLTRFRLKKGIVYLRPGRWYKKQPQ